MAPHCEKVLSEGKKALLEMTGGLSRVDSFSSLNCQEVVGKVRRKLDITTNSHLITLPMPLANYIHVWTVVTGSQAFLTCTLSCLTNLSNILSVSTHQAIYKFMYRIV